MSKLDLSWVKKAVQSGVAFSKKNAPTIMTGGSILMGWTAVYLFWKESRKADAEIEETEEKLAEEETSVTIIVDEDGNEHREEICPELQKKEKAFIYLKNCWPALVMGLGSSGFAIWAHEMDLSRLAEMYMLTQFLEDKDAKKDDLIEKLKSELGAKKTLKVEDELRKEKLPDEKVKEIAKHIPGDGRTLIIDEVTGVKFRSDVEKIKDGIRDFNIMISNKYNEQMKKRFGDAFLAISDISPFPDADFYVAAGLNQFLQCIGENDKDNEIGDLMEFRFYGMKETCINPEDILKYRDYQDPDTGVAAICYLDYGWALGASSRLIEQNPL